VPNPTTPEAAAATAAAAAEAQDAARKDQLAAAMTYHLRVSLGRVLANPDVPQEARDVAVGRLREREVYVERGLERWFQGAMARPDFGGVVLPLLRCVLGPLDAAGGFVPPVDTRGAASSAANGDRMEARALALVSAQLPPGWSLLSNAHVVALDGRHPGHHAACKWEVDLVALDETGTAVAMFEVRVCVCVRRVCRVCVVQWLRCYCTTH